MPPALSRSLCAILILVWALPVNARAQEEGPTDEQQLPEIAPREIEIRGELQLSFPSLQRQPLQGFATPPTLPSVPPARTTYTESYKQELDTLPESLPTPETGSQSVTSQKSPRKGLLEFGGGRYLSRFLEGRFSLPLTDSQRLSFHADYQGTDGHTPFTETDATARSDAIEGRVQFESRHDGLTFLADVHTSAEQYTLYGRPAVVQNPDASAPDRTGLTGGSTLQLRTHGSVDADVELSYDHTEYKTERSPTNDATRAFSDGRLSGTANATFLLSGAEIRLDLSGARSTLGGDAPSSTASSLEGGGTVQIVDATRFSVRAGGRVLSYDVPVAPSVAGSPAATAAFIVPAGRAEFSLAEGVTAHAQNTPGLEKRGLADLYETNPFAVHAPSLRPSLFTTDAEAGLAATLGPVRLQTTAGYRYAPSYQFFVGSSGPASGVFESNYASAEILRGGVEVALQGVTSVEASAGVSVRNGTLIGDDDNIPYFSPVVAETMLSVSFNDQRGLLQTTGTIESARPIDRADSDQVAPYMSVDLEGSYKVTSLLDAVVRIQNIGLSAPKRWARYPRSPGVVMAGFRIRW